MQLVFLSAVPIAESKFSDNVVAERVYTASVRRHLKNGTTFAAYYSTIHCSGSMILVNAVRAAGQRAFVGKISMDRNSPANYVEETGKGCVDAEQFVRDVGALQCLSTESF